MPHPIFDAGTYPLHRPEATSLLAVLTQSISDPHAIDLLYRKCGAGLDPLPLSQPPRVIWGKALDNLATAGALQRFCEELQGDIRYQSRPIREALDGVVNAADASQPPPNAAHPRPQTRRTRNDLELTGPQASEFHDALLDAFTADDLERLCRHRLQVNLANIVSKGAPLETVAFQLIEWAKRQGRVTELVEQSCDQNPGNRKLLSFREKHLGNDSH
jgi:hypothetical protein